MVLSPSKPRKFLGIQALRIVAAVMVVVTHSTFYASERLQSSFPIWQRGTRGVDIFFVISGFVMIYASQKLLARADGWKVFASHRIARIVPLYWLVTTFKVLVLLLTSGVALHARLNSLTVACAYLFLPTRNLDGDLEPLVGVGWTLNFEMMFYFLFTLALYFRKNVFLFLGVALVVLSIGSAFRQPSWPAASFYLNSVVLEFYFGMLLAKACKQGIYLPQGLAAVLLPVGFFLLLLPPFEWNVLPKCVVSGIPAAMIVWSVVSLESIERYLARWVLYLGDASYSIYLAHPFVCPAPPSLFHRLHFGHPWTAVLLSVAAGVGVGCVVHEYVEKPMSARLRAYLQQRERRVATPV